MSYCTSPYAARARGNAMRALILEHKTRNEVAKQAGVHRTTLWRWRKKWGEQNKYVRLTNDNRPHRQAGTQFRLEALKWNIPTSSSAPHTHPNRLSEETVQKIIALRKQHGRCAEVIWYELCQTGVRVSISGVKRTLERYHLINHWSKWKKRRVNTPRPVASTPGALVEVDTVHYVDQISGKRAYITTVIDLYSRMAYARASYKLLPGEATKAIMLVEQKFGYKFLTVQSDNGPEFSSY